jgi:hypothetical protein
LKLELINNKDFWAGTMLIGIGTAAIFVARHYRFGSALHMGPGFFPTILGVIIIGFGICIIAVGLRSNKKIQGNLSLRALILLPLSLILFGKLMIYAGFIPAVSALVFMSAAAGRDFKVVEVLLLAAVMTVASAALFIFGLGLPYSLIKGF